MSLVSQITTFATRVAAEFKAIRTEMAAISGGGGGGGSGVPVYVQEAQPAAPALWYKTDASGVVIDILRVT